MARKLLSEREILDAAKKGSKTLAVSSDTIVTAAARDRAQQLGIRLVPEDTKVPDGKGHPKAEPSGPPPGGRETIVVGSDQGGFQLKEKLKPYLEELGYKVVDVGTYTEEACDYPDFAYAVARTVSLGEAQKGIMIDAVGVASAMVANKVPGVRAACCHDSFSAKSSREHNNANVLTLGGRVVGLELAKSVVKDWLQTWFGGGRHEKRLEKIRDIESRFLKP